MKRCAFVLIVFFVTTIPIHSQARRQSRKNGTWYEQALHSLNPNDIDYGSIWEERKRAILHQIGEPCFQYSVAATAALVVLFTLVCVQRVSRKPNIRLTKRQRSTATCPNCSGKSCRDISSHCRTCRTDCLRF